MHVARSGHLGGCRVPWARSCLVTRCHCRRGSDGVSPHHAAPQTGASQGARHPRARWPAAPARPGPGKDPLLVADAPFLPRAQAVDGARCLSSRGGHGPWAQEPPLTSAGLSASQRLHPQRQRHRGLGLDRGFEGQCPGLCEVQAGLPGPGSWPHCPVLAGAAVGHRTACCGRQVCGRLRASCSTPGVRRPCPVV